MHSQDSESRNTNSVQANNMAVEENNFTNSSVHSQYNSRRISAPSDQEVLQQSSERIHRRKMVEKEQSVNNKRNGSGGLSDIKYPKSEIFPTTTAGAAVPSNEKKMLSMWC